jgi:hypothetical protein
VSKSHQEKVRSVVQIIAFAVFSILIITSVIQWSVRWAGLAALLFVQAVRGLWTLLNSKRQQGVYKARSVIFRATAAMLWIFIFVTPALIFPQYQPLTETGPYVITTERDTYTDEQ